MKAVRVIVSGRVQGVWYRGWTIETAFDHGVDGWVRNRRDGTVEAVFAGDDEQVEAMIQACHRGPTTAWVTGIERFDHQEPVEPGFHPKPTL